LKGAPGYLARNLKDVQAVCKPAIDVQGHGVAVYGSDCCVFDWNGMSSKLVEEALTKLNRLDKSPAARVLSVSEHRGVHDLLLDQT
jgi:hypothetical protein